MRRILLFFISLFVGIGLVIWVFRLLGWEEIKAAFLIFTGWQGLIILLVTVLILLCGMWKWKIILKNLGHNLSSRQLAGPYLAGFSLIYLFPMIIFGGEIFRGYVLKERFGVPWAKGISSVIIDRILEMTAFLITILAGIIFFLFKIGLPPRNLGIIFGGVLFFLVAGTIFFYVKSFKKQSIAKRFLRFFGLKRFANNELMEIEKEIFNFFKPKKEIMWRAFGLAFLRVGATWLRCWLLLLFLGKTIGIFSVLSILGFYYFALMIPIPTALGSHEVVQFFSFEALGLGTNTALAFTFIQRGAELVLAFLGLIVFFKLGMGLLQTFFFKRIKSLARDSK